MSVAYVICSMRYQNTRFCSDALDDVNDRHAVCAGFCNTSWSDVPKAPAGPIFLTIYRLYYFLSRQTPDIL